MKTESYDIVGSYNHQRVVSIDAERSVNLFEFIDPNGKKPKSLLPTSGLADTLFQFAGGADGWRAQFVVFSGTVETMFGVIGENIYRIDQFFNVTQINPNPLTSNVGYVGIDANNGNSAGEIEVIFVDGDKGYIYNLTTTIFVQITDPAFPVKPIDVTYLDGFFVVANGDTNGFQLSSLNEGLIWGADNTGSAIVVNVAAASADIVLATGSNAFYQIGTPVVFTAGVAELVAGTVYYVVGLTGANIIRVSATSNGAAIVSALGGASTITNNGQVQEGFITSHPGTIVACKTLHRRLFLFSQNFTEVWENAGIGTNLPFRRNNGLLMEYGTPAVGSVSVGFDRMIFLSQDRDGLGSVMEVVGTEAIPISERSLDYELAQFVSDPLIGIADARCFLIKENGLIFYRLNLTKANHTYVYGVSMSTQEDKNWHEEEVLNGDRHPAQTHGFFYGRNYVGSYLLPKLYLVDDSYNTNDGEAIRRMRIGRPEMPPTSQRLRVDRFQLDLLQGQLSAGGSSIEELEIFTEDALTLLTEADVSIITDQGLIIFDADDNPTVFLSVSKDGGQSYGYRVQAPMGKVGQRTFRTVWRKLGCTKRGQAFVPKIEFFNKTPFVILGATWCYEVLPE